MAYLSFSEATAGRPGVPAPLARAGLASCIDPAPRRAAERPSFSALEWSVIALARRDGLSSLRSPGRVSLAMGVLFGDRTNTRLADPRLEALRRIAVLTWHRGYSVAPSEVRRFYEAGFDSEQYELLVDSIAADRARPRGGRA